MQSNVSDVEILESARAPRNPESGRRKLIVLLTGIIVFVFGASYLIVKELLSPATKSEKDFTDAIRIPLFANLRTRTALRHKCSIEIYRSCWITSNVVRLDYLNQ
jgi:capsular polysaccharide biosynthesis protein